MTLNRGQKLSNYEIRLISNGHNFYRNQNIKTKSNFKITEIGILKLMPLIFPINFSRLLSNNNGKFMLISKTYNYLYIYIYY